MKSVLAVLIGFFVGICAVVAVVVGWVKNLFRTPVSYRQLLLRAILCLIGLIIFVYCLPVRAERLSIDEIEDLALSTGVNQDGIEGQMTEAQYAPHIWKDGVWDCKDRSIYCLWLLRENGYEGELATQRDSMGNPVHMYVIWKDGNCRRPLMKNRAWMQDIENSLERMKRTGR